MPSTKLLVSTSSPVAGAKLPLFLNLPSLEIPAHANHRLGPAGQCTIVVPNSEAEWRAIAAWDQFGCQGSAPNLREVDYRLPAPPRSLGNWSLLRSDAAETPETQAFRRHKTSFPLRRPELGRKWPISLARLGIRNRGSFPANKRITGEFLQLVRADIALLGRSYDYRAIASFDAKACYAAKSFSEPRLTAFRRVYSVSRSRIPHQ